MTPSRLRVTGTVDDVQFGRVKNAALMLQNEADNGGDGIDTIGKLGRQSRAIVVSMHASDEQRHVGHRTPADRHQRRRHLCNRHDGDQLVGSDPLRRHVADTMVMENCR